MIKNYKTNYRLKLGLVCLSFAPMFIMLFLRNLIELTFDNVQYANIGTLNKMMMFLAVPSNCLCAICIIYFLFSLLSFLKFKQAETYGFDSLGERIKNLKEIKGQAPAFAIIYIIPWLTPSIKSVIGLFALFLGITIIIGMVWVTDFYYNCPFLRMLGYKTYLFKFKNTKEGELKNKRFICITQGNLNESKIVKRKYISGNVFLMYNDFIGKERYAKH